MPSWLFRTPLITRGSSAVGARRSEHALMRHFSRQVGTAVLIIDGQVVARAVPTTAETAAASHVFLGGHDNVVTDQQTADLLAAAGYQLVGL